MSAFRVDYPTEGPDNEENFDVGVNLMIDGATGAIVRTYRHPDPDPGSIFGFTIYNQPAIGNAVSTPVPDVYLPAAGQDTDRYRGEGIGFRMNGASLVSGNTVDLQRFRSPNPTAGRSFGTSDGDRVQRVAGHRIEERDLADDAVVLGRGCGSRTRRSGSRSRAR